MVQHIGTFTTGHVVTASEMNLLGPYFSSGAGAPAGTGANSDTYYDTTNKRTYVSDGSGWTILSEPAQSYTPSWTGITVGNGSNTGVYHRSDGYCHFRAHLIFGSTTSVSGAATVSFPVATASGGYTLLHTGIYYDASATSEFALYSRAATTSTTVMGFGPLAAGGTYASTVAMSATIPVAYATGDAIEIVGVYKLTTRYS